MRYQQKAFWPQSLTDGGELTIGKAKQIRPVAVKRPMHFVIKSSLAKGVWSFLTARNSRVIKETLQRFSKRYGLTIYEYSIGGNHIHMVLRSRSRESLKGFLKALSGRIAQQITGSKKGKPQGRPFFDYIPFSRILSWGRDFCSALSYVIQNQLEAFHLIPYTPRKKSAGP